MSDTIDILKGIAAQIRKASEQGENTAERVGRILVGILELMNNVGIEDIEKFFIRKDVADNAQEFITFIKGWLTSNYMPSAQGAGLIQDVDGNWHLQSDYLHVNKKLTANEIEIQKTSHIGGRLMMTAARMVCTRVEEYATFYRCYMNLEDGEDRKVYNQFKVDDQALCETFNMNNNQFYWRLVVAMGEDYIDLSKEVCSIGSNVPLADDDIVQFGYRGSDDKERQNAQILAGAGVGSPYIKQYVGINSFTLPAEYTRLKPGDNLFTGQMHMQAGSDGAKNLTDLPDFVSEAVKIGGENLLMNTGFTGNYESEELSNDTKLDEDSQLYSKQLQFWIGTASVNEDPAATSGFSATIGALSQNVSLIQNEHYVLSFKAKGSSLAVSVGSYSENIKLSDGYKQYEIKFTHSNGNICLFSGTAILCDIQLERGTIRTDWRPSSRDNSEVADKFKHLTYLQDAIKNGSVDVLGGLILANMLMLGNYDNGVMQKVTAGISGIYNDDDDVAFWGGGTLQQAIATVMKFKQNPHYNPTDEEWKNLANFVVTHGGDAFFKGTAFIDDGWFRGMVSIANGKILLDKDGSGQLADGSISWDAEGNPIIKGKITTAFDGKRIVFDAESNSFKMIGSNEQIMFDLSFAESDIHPSYPMLAMNTYNNQGERVYRINIALNTLSIKDVDNNLSFMTPTAIQVSRNNNEEASLLRSDGLFLYKDGKLTKSYN